MVNLHKLLHGLHIGATLVDSGETEQKHDK